MLANQQERGCGRQHHECSRVARISGRTNGRGKRTKSVSNTSILPVSYSSRTKIVLAVLDRRKSGVKATIWWFCHDHDRSGQSAMIRNISEEWSAQCDLGFRLGSRIGPHRHRVVVEVNWRGAQGWRSISWVWPPSTMWAGPLIC